MSNEPTRLSASLDRPKPGSGRRAKSGREALAGMSRAKDPAWDN